jgi:flagellar hook-basal body complex protein FliE
MLASGEDVDVHGTMIALQEADISLRTMTAFRDKMSEAYKNLINMAI